MGQCLVHRTGSPFKAWIEVQANPGATVTATGTKKVYTAVADAITGIAQILIKKKGIYTLSSDCTATEEAIGNTSQISVTVNKETYVAQFVKLNKGYTTFAVRDDYQNNSLLAYWDGTVPNEYCSSYYLEEVASSGNVGKYTGTGASYEVDTSTTVNGYLDTVTSGTTKIYRLTAYIVINGTNYYGGEKIASGTAKTYSSYSTNVAATGTLTVPAGCRSITAFVVGGGGKGGNGYFYTNYNWQHVVVNPRDAVAGGAGGGGGYVASKTIDCIPGQTISCVVGASASDSSLSVNGITCTAPKGSGGGNAYNVSQSTYTDDRPSGGSGNGNGGQGQGFFHGSSGSYGASSPTAGSNGYGGGGGGGGCVGFYISASTDSDYWKVDVKRYGVAGASPGGGKGGGWSGDSSDTTNAYTKEYRNKYPVAGTANTGGGGGGGSWMTDRTSNPSDSSTGWVFWATNGASGGSGVVKITFNY